MLVYLRVAYAIYWDVCMNTDLILVVSGDTTTIPA